MAEKRVSVIVGNGFDLPVETTRVVHHDAEYDTIYHEAEGHYETRTVRAAYDEEVITGYTCSSCGDTK